MEEKKGIKFSFATILFIIAIIIIVVMGACIYKLNKDKALEVQKSTKLQEQVTNLNGTVSDLQGKINSISDTISGVDTTDTTSANVEKKESETSKVSSVNKRLYKLYSKNRYILLMEDNEYSANQDFLKKKTYILDLDMRNGNDVVKEVDISSKLKPFVDEYISKNKGSLSGNFIVKYYGVDDMMTPPDIDAENEVAFQVSYNCVDGNVETSMGTVVYAYNVKTGVVRDLGGIN